MGIFWSFFTAAAPGGLSVALIVNCTSFSLDTEVAVAFTSVADSTCGIDCTRLRSWATLSAERAKPFSSMTLFEASSCSTVGPEPSSLVGGTPPLETIVVSHASSGRTSEMSRRKRSHWTREPRAVLRAAVRESRSAMSEGSDGVAAGSWAGTSSAASWPFSAFSSVCLSATRAFAIRNIEASSANTTSAATAIPSRAGLTRLASVPPEAASLGIRLNARMSGTSASAGPAPFADFLRRGSFGALGSLGSASSDFLRVSVNRLGFFSAGSVGSVVSISTSSCFGFRLKRSDSLISLLACPSAGHPESDGDGHGRAAGVLRLLADVDAD